MLTNIALMFLFIFSSASCQNLPLDLSCSTKNGTCVLVYTCDYALNLIKEKKYNEARNMFCGFDDEGPKVCCPKEKSRIFYNETEPSATRRPQPLSTPKIVENKAEADILSTTTAPINWDPFPDRSICGQVISGNKIIGGQVAGIDEFPWLARIKMSIRGKEQYLCAGSLITDRHILTAAHCVRNNYKILSVRLGEFDTSTEQDCIETECNDKPLDVSVIDVIPHPRSSTTEPIKADIALLVLEQSVNFTDFIQPVCLPTTEYTAAQDYLRESTYTTAGWGITEYDDVSTVKRKIQLNAVPIDICQTAFSKKTIPENYLPYIICAGGRKNQDTCRGDSGGSLVREVSENYTSNWYLYGITSTGSRVCGQEGFPGVYTRVTKFIDWIREQVART